MSLVVSGQFAFNQSLSWDAGEAKENRKAFGVGAYDAFIQFAEKRGQSSRS